MFVFLVWLYFGYLVIVGFGLNLLLVGFDFVFIGGFVVMLVFFGVVIIYCMCLVRICKYWL